MNGCVRLTAGLLVGIASSAPAVSAEEEKKVVKAGNTVSIEYTLTLDDGSTADSNVGGEALVYEQGAEQILPALEAALVGLSVGDTKTVDLTAEQGYGPVHPEGFHTVPLEQIPEEARSAGAQLVSVDEQGNQRPVRVHEVREEEIVVDLNHPLAGQALHFDVKILAIEN